MAAEKPTTAQSAKETIEIESKKSSRKKPFLIVAVLMVLEGIGVFLGTKMLAGSGPAIAEAERAAETAHGARSAGGHGGDSEQGDAAKTAPIESEYGEIAVSECRPTNRESGRLVTYRMRVSVLVKAADLEKTKTLIEAHKARIDDRINFVIRSAEPQFLHEPTLATVKRRLKAEFDRLLGDDHLVEEVLIPEMLASAPGL